MSIDASVGWPFDQPPNCAVITLRQIIELREPILHVTHDLDDHGWQFLGAGDAQIEDGAVICYAHILELDSTIRELADMPPGWCAWRATSMSPWIREPSPLFGDGD
jgi:hypothetical protein